MSYDLVIRNGLVVDGSDSEPWPGDVAVRDGLIAAIGSVEEDGREEIDATGLLVTPGFVDIHTHYDGQAVWSDSLASSSQHGVTTVVIGNCGVGFAPCRPGDRGLLINAMEGVEDIPGVVMTEGLVWEWESFPEYLDFLDSKRYDVDIAAFVPHSPLRVYAMGERGANREVARADDLARMATLAGEAMDVGALGFATSRIESHRRGDLEYLPTFQADEAELHTLASAVSDRGIMQLVSNMPMEAFDRKRDEIQLLGRVSRQSGIQVTFAVNQQNGSPADYDKILAWIDEANADPHIAIRPQFAPRPIGVYAGFDLSTNPFAACPTYRGLAHLPLEARMVELRKPEIRERIVNETPDTDVLPLVLIARNFGLTFVVSDPPSYEPPPSMNVAVQAAARGVSPAEHAYDLMLEQDGHAMLYVAISNYGRGNLDHLVDTFQRTDSVIGLGDGGAHYAMICDYSYPTFMLTHWSRDRPGARLTVGEAVRAMTSVPADLVGLHDRGRIAPGYKADLNVIDYDNLQLSRPRVVRDLPAGGARLDQSARGYRATIVSGQIIARDDRATGSRPGRLVRGRQSVPA